VSAVDSYATALFEVARAEGSPQTVVAELAAFGHALETSPDLHKALVDQLIPVERRQGVVAELLGGKANPVTVNLVSFVVGAGRAKDLSSIVAKLRELSATDQGRASGEVRSAHPLSLDQQQRLTAAVSKSTGKAVELTFLVDPSVLGGVVTTVGDTVIDGTIRHRLEQLKDAV
jgi:F-type H+-transporting ATPase subunit delta